MCGKISRRMESLVTLHVRVRGYEMVCGRVSSRMEAVRQPGVICRMRRPWGREAWEPGGARITRLPGRKSPHRRHHAPKKDQSYACPHFDLRRGPAPPPPASAAGFLSAGIIDHDRSSCLPCSRMDQDTHDSNYGSVFSWYSATVTLKELPTHRAGHI